VAGGVALFADETAIPAIHAQRMAGRKPRRALRGNRGPGRLRGTA
jgi:NADPH-dependent ferric siderophore reductase